MNEKKEKYEIENKFEDEIDSENEENIVVLSEEAGSRIDKFLSERLELTRTRIQQLIKDENILVNEKKTKPAYKIEENDTIKVVIPELETVEIKPENIDIEIIYEDNDLAVINKKAGIVVHPANGHYSGTLVNAILYHIKDLSGINGEIRPGIVHRLDKDTSGLLIIAKNDKSHLKLSQMFHDKTVKKTYLAILKGKLNKKSGRIVTQIGRDKNDRKKMTVINDLNSGKTAITNYEVISQTEKFTLVKVHIETGRTHQIRVHMKHLGYPILGDSVYGRTDAEKRQMLHAYKLEFQHPITEENLEFIAKLPEDFKKAFIEFLDSSKYVRTKVNGIDDYVDKGITFKNQFGCDDIVNLFLKVVKEHKLPIEESIGYRVYSIVRKDVSKLDSLIEEELLYDTVYSPYREDKILETELKFQRDIIKAGQDYIESLYYTHKSRNEAWNKLREEGEI